VKGKPVTKLGWAGALVSVVCCSACVPFTAIISPQVDGTIVDDTTSHPIQDAIIVIHPGFPPRYDGPTTTVVSDIAGRFAAEEKAKRIWLPPLPFDLFYPYAKLSVSATGYEPEDQDLYLFFQEHPGERDVTIRLKHT
jgi:hypothetical protein